jgi:hypothetical protein
MFIAAGAITLGLLGLAVIARELRNAPEGYEDEFGFHSVGEQTRVRNLPSAGVKQHRRSGSESKVRRPVARHA